jgi:hypothetical protein
MHTKEHSMKVQSSKSVRVALASLLLAVGFPALAGADVSKYVAKDALGLVRVSSAEGVSKKFADFAAKVGLAAMQPDLADPLGSLLEKGEIKEGLRKDGELGIILLPAAQWTEDKPGVVLLLPVSDYKAFLGNFKDAKTEGEVSTINFGGEESFVSSWGEYAAIAPVKAHVATKGSGLVLNAAAKKAMASSDVVIWANIPALKAALGDKFAEGKAEALAEMESALEGNDEMKKYIPTAKALAGQFFAAGETFLSNAQGATISLTINEVGINGTITAEFAPETYLGKWVAGLSGNAGSFTVGLPAKSYMFYGGSALDGKSTSTLLRDLAAPVLAELDKVEGVDNAAVKKTFDGILSAAEATKLATFGVPAPRAAFGTDSLFQAVYYIKADSKKYVAGMRDYAEGYAKLMEPLKGTAMMPMEMEFKPASRTVEGVAFDVLAMVANPNPKTPEEAQMAQMMTMMYGPGGMSYATGVVDDSTVVMGLALSDANLTELVQAAKAGADPLGKTGSASSRTLAQLPKNSAAVAYIAVDEIAKTAIHYAKQFGMPVNVAIPDDLAPVGLAITADGTALHLSGHVPTELIQSLVAAALEVQGGRGGGGL